MKTLDGYDLKEGDECFVGIEDPYNEIDYSGKILKAVYRNEYAKDMGYDFEISQLKADHDVEVINVWKNNPINPHNPAH